MTTFEKLEDLIYHGFKDTAKRFEETAKQFQETDKRSQETAKQFQETDRRIKETEALLEKTGLKVDRVAQLVGDITDSLGRFAESTVFPAVIPLLKARGIKINRLWGRLPSVEDGYEMELDIAGIGPKCAIVIEVKLRLKQKYVEEFLRTLPKVFDYYPLLRRPLLYGGMAGMTIDKGADRFAYKKGLFILSQTGDNLRIVNDQAFKPRSFHAAGGNGARKRKKA